MTAAMKLRHLLLGRKAMTNPLQCSCLENPRDTGAWWAAVYGVAQSPTQLKRLSSSSSCLYKDFPGGSDSKVSVVIHMRF